MHPDQVEAHYREIALNTSERKRHIANKRAEQVTANFDEKSKINFFMFSIIGALLALNPSALKNLYTIVGVLILVINAVLFGWIAQTVQRALNIKYFDSTSKNVANAFEPLMTAYHSPSPEREVKFAAALEEYRAWYLTRADSYSKRTFLGNSWIYFTLLTIGLLLLGVGVYKNIP